jgi:hypothetical protein
MATIEPAINKYSISKQELKYEQFMMKENSSSLLIRITSLMM